jgi:dimethylargininase
VTASVRPAHPLLRPARALLRAVPDSYARHYGPPDDPAGFLATARRQHEGYARTLRDAGVAVEVLPPDEAHPDCHFVEDPAIVVGDTALVCHLGRADRRGEEPPVAARLVALGYRVERLAPPATLEGGDVLQVGERVFVGRSERTNDAGVAALAAVVAAAGRRLEVVPLTRCFHLKTAVTAFSTDGLLVAKTLLPPGLRFDGFEVVPVPTDPDDETYAANCLALGERVLLPAGHLKTAALLEARGFRVSLLPMSAFQAGDGALTCLSVLLP